MAITVKCKCGKRLKAADTAAGKKAKCPECGTIVRFPDPNEIYDAGDDVEAMDDFGSSYDDDSSECPHCGKTIKPGAKKCPSCRRSIDGDSDDDFDEDDSYAAPRKSKSSGKSKSRKRKSRGSTSVASRSSRLVGAILDNFVIVPCMIPGLILMGAGAPTHGAAGAQGNGSPALALIGLVLFFVAIIGVIIANLCLMANGQTIGKYIMNTQVVDYDTDEPISLVRYFFVRGLLNNLLTLIPFYGLVDVLMIFSDDCRCFHDRLANTYVVDIS